MSTNPFPKQLSDDSLVAQFDALRAIERPTFTNLIDLKATLDEIVERAGERVIEGISAR
jgi:hypothetical protein